MFADLGRTLMFFGALLFLVGLIIMLAGRLPGLGHLPGDVAFKRGNFQIYAPFGTMLVLSILLTLFLNVISRLLR
jgi:hypothetical protein